MFLFIHLAFVGYCLNYTVKGPQFEEAKAHTDLLKPETCRRTSKRFAEEAKAFSLEIPERRVRVARARAPPRPRRPRPE